MNRAFVMEAMDDAAAAGRLAVQCCVSCGTQQYPPRELCGACLCTDLSWNIHDSLEGTMIAVTALQHSQELEFRPALPLRVGMVQLDFGASAMCFVKRAEAGARVRVTASLDPHGRAVLTAEVTP